MGSKCAIGATVLASRIRNTLFLLSLFFSKKKEFQKECPAWKKTFLLLCCTFVIGSVAGVVSLVTKYNTGGFLM